MENLPNTPLMSEAALAEGAGVTVKTVRNWRSLGKGPAFVRVTERLVVYRVCDVEAWLAANLVGGAA